MERSKARCAVTGHDADRCNCRACMSAMFASHQMERSARVESFAVLPPEVTPEPYAVVRTATGFDVQRADGSLYCSCTTAENALEECNGLNYPKYVVTSSLAPAEPFLTMIQAMREVDKRKLARHELVCIHRYDSRDMGDMGGVVLYGRDGLTVEGMQEANRD